MKDQVDNLKRHGIKAVCFHSGMSGKEVRYAWEKLMYGKAKFLYIARNDYKTKDLCWNYVK